MSYMTDLRQVAGPEHLSTVFEYVHPPARPPASLLARINTRLSTTLEVAILVATLSGISLVLSTIAAGAF